MEVRINKYLSSAGYCSRREADRLLEQGRVTIDGIPAQMGSKVTDGQTVFVDGKSIIEEDENDISYISSLKNNYIALKSAIMTELANMNQTKSGPVLTYTSSKNC